jgi:outer membrane receptor for ferrienterochelin and colicins
MAQSEMKWKKWSLQQGVRVIRQQGTSETPVVPRTALRFALNGQWSFRFSYAQGWKAPQAFETDLHIAFSGGGISTIKLDPQLRSERSHAFNVSGTWNRRWKNNLFDYTISGFINQLKHPFVLEELGQDSSGNTQLLRTNGSSANVMGFSLDTRTLLTKNYQIELGFTIQEASYLEGIKWSNEVASVRRFLRTPNVYGYLNVTFFPEQKWSGTLANTYTGSMLVPHFGGSISQAVDELTKSDPFFDLTLRVERKFHFHRWKQNLKIGAGVQNLLNAYQQDFDLWKERDSNYIYGPAKPRTFILRLTWYTGE